MHELNFRQLIQVNADVREEGEVFSKNGPNFCQLVSLQIQKMLQFPFFKSGYFQAQIYLFFIQKVIFHNRRMLVYKWYVMEFNFRQLF